MKKPNRNEPCPCGSGKKFKKCCEISIVRGRFKVTRIDSQSALQAQTRGLSSLFQAHLASTPPSLASVEKIAESSVQQ